MQIEWGADRFFFQPVFCWMNIAVFLYVFLENRFWKHFFKTLLCLSCGQVLAPHPLSLLTSACSHITESWSYFVLFVNAIQRLICPSSFLPQSVDGLSSLSGFFVLTKDRKGLWYSFLSETAWACRLSYSLAPLQLHSENILPYSPMKRTVVCEYGLYK